MFSLFKVNETTSSMVLSHGGEGEAAGRSSGDITGRKATFYTGRTPSGRDRHRGFRLESEPSRETSVTSTVPSLTAR
jgi:hypothetical protein